MNDLFNLDINTSLSAFEPKKRTADGLFRADLDKVKDPAAGYNATIRFLPNLTADKKVGEMVLEKFTNWINIPSAPHLNGAFPSKKNLGEKCPISELFWKLKNAGKEDLAKMVSGSVQYYSYVLIVKDEQQPELEGKIMVMQYGKKIADKIKEEKMGMGEAPCNVFDLLDGKDFFLNVKKVGGFNNYDSCKFLSRGALKMNGKAISASDKKNVYTWLLNRDKNLEDFQTLPWNEETTARANEILTMFQPKKQEEVFPVKETKQDAEIDGFFEDL